MCRKNVTAITTTTTISDYVHDDSDDETEKLRLIDYDISSGESIDNEADESDDGDYSPTAISHNEDDSYSDSSSSSSSSSEDDDNQTISQSQQDRKTYENTGEHGCKYLLSDLVELKKKTNSLLKKKSSINKTDQQIQ